MNIQFTKMQGAGNDLVMIDGYSTPIALTANQIKRISDRHFGVGCDQLLMVERTNTPNVDFRYRIFNADGNEVEHCGNGARCFVRFVFEKGLTQKREIVVETLNGIITLTLHDNNQVTVNMGMPRFAPDAIPFIAENTSHQYDLEVNGETYIISALSMGNPHAVLLVDDVENAPVVPLGTAIEAHPRFPEHVNVGFMQIVNTHEVKLRVFERGSGETLACGTGACAAVVAGIQLGKLISPVKVSARGGELHIAWQGPEFSVMMTGPAESVFTGTISIE